MPGKTWQTSLMDSCCNRHNGTDRIGPALCHCTGGRSTVRHAIDDTTGVKSFGGYLGIGQGTATQYPALKSNVPIAVVTA